MSMFTLVYGICIPWKKLVELKYVEEISSDYTAPSLYPLEVFYVPRERVEEMSKNRPGFIPPGETGQEIVCVGVQIMSYDGGVKRFPSLSEIIDASRLFGIVAPEKIIGNGGKRDLIFITTP